jgi:mRNA-degrading endonuclease YafQ of YafQ-DinJ toxin-antitoxin module
VRFTRVDRFEFSKKFEKAFARLTAGEQGRIKTALITAASDLSDPRLRQHELKGVRAGTVSLNGGGDLRVLCRLFDEDGQTVALLLIVGTHSQLYG